MVACAPAVAVDEGVDNCVGEGVGAGVDEGVGEPVESGFVLTFVPVLAVDELPVFWLQVTGLALLSIATLKVPLRA